METDITPFAYGDQQVRVVTRDGEPWFVAADIAKTLGYRIAPDMVRSLDEDEKGTQIVRTPGGRQQMTIISEAGLYSAIVRSRVEGAKAFKRWVTHDVLPSIRKRGDLVSPPADLTVLEYADGIELRTARDGDEVIVCLVDLAHGLGITDVSRLASRLPDGVRRTHPILDRLGRVQQATFVTEAGMNMVIWRSDKPAAVAYAQWCAERIAELRRHGMTATPDTVEAMLADPDSMIRALTALKEERARRQAAEAQIEADAPHARFGRTISGTDGDLLVKQVADLITQGGYPISQVTLFKWLRNHGWLCANQGRLWNSPTKWALEQGYVRSTVLVVSTSRGDQEKTTPRITTAGQEDLIDGWLTGRYTEDN